MKIFNSGWYVIYTRSKQEKKVTQQLSEKNIGSFFPTVKTVRQWHDRKKILQLPLFPSYVFVRLNSSEDFYNGLHSEGVSSYVKLGKEPARINQAIIDEISMVVSNGENVSVSSEYFKCGQKLLIRKGALNGLLCEVVQYDGRKKIVVRVNLLNRIILVDFPAQDLASFDSLQ